MQPQPSLMTNLHAVRCILLLICSPVAAFQKPGASTVDWSELEADTANGRGGSQELRAWLQGVELTLPAFRLPDKLLEGLGISLDVRSGTCKNLTVSSVQVPATVDSATAAEFKTRLSGVGIGCDTAVTLKSVLTGSVDMAMSFAMDNMDVSLSTLLQADVDGLPNRIQFSDCMLTLNVQSLHFAGSGLTAHLLHFLEGAIRTAVNKFPRLFCEHVESEATAQLTDVINTFKQKWQLKAYLEPSPPLSDLWISNAANLDDLLWTGPLGIGFRNAFREVAHTDDMPRFNIFIQHLTKSLGLGSGAGDLSLLPGHSGEVQRTVVLPGTNGTVAVEVSVSELVLIAVDSFSSLHASVQQQAVGGSMALRPGGRVTADVHFKLPTTRPAQLTLGNSTIFLRQAEQLAPLKLKALGQTLLDSQASVSAAFDPSHMRALQLDQMQHAGCAPQMLMHTQHSQGLQLNELRAALAVSSANISLPSRAVGALEVDLLRAGAAIGGVLNATFGGTGSRLLDGLVSSVVRDMINDRADAFLLSSPSCPATNFSSGHMPAIDYACRSITSCSFVTAGMFALLAYAMAHWRNRLKACTPKSWHGFFGCRPEVETSRACGPSPMSQSAISTEAFSSPATFDRSLPSQSPTSIDEAQECALRGQHSPEAIDIQLPHEAPFALGSHPVVPRWLRAAVTLCIVGDMGLFVTGVTTVAVEIVLSSTLADGSIWISPSIANLSVANSITNMWTAKSYPLLAAVLLFTVLWPQIKLALMLYVWWRPLHTARREQFLVFLDQIGKWSLADTFVMFLLEALFYVSWSNSEARLTVDCTPMPCFFALIAATIVSLLLGHSMLAIHRFVKGDFTNIACVGRTPLWKTVGLRRSACVRGLFRAGVAVGLLVALVLLAVAWCCPMVSFRIDGIVGSLLDVTDQPRVSTYSLADVVHSLFQRDRRFFACVIAFFTGILPAAALVFLMCLWLMPLASRKRLVLLTLCQTLLAWSSIDVWCVALLGAVLGGDEYGLGNFIELIIYTQNVAPLCDFLRDDVGLICVSTKVEFLPSVFCLFFAAVFSVAMSHAVTRAVRVGNARLRDLSPRRQGRDTAGLFWITP
eukprot:TRINITY_DN41772_c0_g1_i1.p1 TRINITY_DN41772_c0_g1~~TRINITY_DN41772_c0_g1_i1.p1  ORF type:complete len:1094 (-),score=98.29 TRINITY_DN41772_c0_g1_i1:122-3403(-)